MAAARIRCWMIVLLALVAIGACESEQHVVDKRKNQALMPPAQTLP